MVDSPRLGSTWLASRRRDAATGFSLALLLCLVGATPALAGCAEDAGQVRLLDRICRRTVNAATGNEALTPCAVEGDAQVTTGITSDSIGVVIGPRYGLLRIRLRAIDQLSYSVTGLGLLHTDSWSLDALMASAREEGSLVTRTIHWGGCNGCPEDPVDFAANLPESYNWVPAVESLPGVVGGFEAPVPDDAWILLSGADLQIADIRLPGIDSTPYDSY